MPTITINIAGRGTRLADGTQSATGHMWYSLNDGSGNPPASYGFAPDSLHEGKPIAPGEVHRDDDTNYQSRDYTKTIEITDTQYNDIKSFGENPQQTDSIWTTMGFQIVASISHGKRYQSGGSTQLDMKEAFGQP
jgi:hypothetical protein